MIWGKVDISIGELTSPSHVGNDLLMFHRVGGWVCTQNDMGKVDISNGELTSPSEVGKDLLMFHRVGGWVSTQNDMGEGRH